MSQPHPKRRARATSGLSLTVPRPRAMGSESPHSRPLRLDGLRAPGRCGLPDAPSDLPAEIGVGGEWRGTRRRGKTSRRPPSISPSPLWRSPRRARPAPALGLRAPLS